VNKYLRTVASGRIFISNVYECEAVQGQSSFSVSCKPAYPWVRINCCFQSDTLEVCPVICVLHLH